MNCFVVPSAMFWLVGDTLIETSVAGVTVRVVLPKTEPDVAFIVVDPVPTDVARPLLFTVATVDDEELQTADEVRSWVVLLE